MAGIPESQKRGLLEKLHGNAGVGVPVAGSNALSCYQQLYALYFSDEEYLKAATVAYSLYAALDRALRQSGTGFAEFRPRNAVSPFARASGQVSPVLEQQRSALLMLISALTLCPAQRLLMPSADRPDAFIAAPEAEVSVCSLSALRRPTALQATFRGFIDKEWIPGFSAQLAVRAEPMPGENVSIPASSDDEDGGRSPAKVARAANGDQAVTLSDLRAILLEQTKQLQESNQSSVDKAFLRMEKSLDSKLGEFEGRVSGIDDRVGALEKQIEELLRRDRAGEPVGGGRDDADRRARTLVYGGWARETRRKIILDDLAGLLSSLQVSDLLDSDPFTTGARRSMALSSFKQRAHESFADMRSRMHKIVIAFAKGGLEIKGGGRAWCSFSKTKAERAKGAHAGWIKRVVSEMKADQVANLDIEWQSGSVWLEDTLLGSSDLPVPPGTDMRGVLVNEDQEAKPWISVKLLSKELKQKEKDVWKEADSQLRIFGWNLGGVEVQDLPQLLRDAAAGASWRQVAQDRVVWQTREQTWINNMDLPWSSAAVGAMGVLFFRFCLMVRLIWMLAASGLDGGAAVTEVLSSYRFPRTLPAMSMAPDLPLPLPDSPDRDRTRRELYFLRPLHVTTSALCDRWTEDLSVSDETSWMQGSVSSRAQPTGWFTRARERFLELQAGGKHKCAALHLRDLLRVAHPSICRAAREYVPLILGDSDGQNVREVTADEEGECKDWANMVLASLTNLVPQSELATVPAETTPGSSLPFGIFHAVHVWPNGTWSTAADLATSSGNSGVEPAAEVEHGTGMIPRLDTDEDDSSLITLGHLVVVLGPLRPRGFDELWDGRVNPDWFLDQADILEKLANRGAHGPTMALWLEDLFLNSGDQRLVNEMSRYINGLRYRMDTYVPYQNALTRASGVPDEAEWQTAVRGIFDFMKERWLWRLCPTAMWNQRHERYLADRGYCNVEFSPEHYVGEESERRALSRSRSPHRRDRQPWRVNEDWSGWQDGTDSEEGMQNLGPGTVDVEVANPRLLLKIGVTQGGTRMYAAGRLQGARSALSLGLWTRMVVVVAVTLGIGQDPSVNVVKFLVFASRAMNTWRQLLGTSESPGSELLVQHGGPIISDQRYRAILEHLRGRPEQERMIMSIAVVSYRRALMVELGEVCHEASLQITTLDESDDVLVEVEEDVSNLMQTLNSDIKRDTAEDHWARLMVRLQKELAEQTGALRRSHVGELLGRLRATLGAGLETGLGAQLEALLLVMLDRDVQPCSPGVDPWMADWTRTLSQSVPDLDVEVHSVPEDSLGDEDLMRAVQEAEATTAPPGEPASSSWQCPGALTEVLMLRAQEHAVLLHQAENYRDWEAWEIQQSLCDREPLRSRRQCVVKVEGVVSKGCGEGGPSMTRSWHMEVPEQGSLRLNVHLYLEDAVDQEDIETEITQDTKRRRRELAEQAAHAGTDVSYAQYADLYRQWVQGTLNARQIVNRYGPELLEHFEAQFATTEDYVPKGPGVAPDNPLQPLPAHGCVEYSRYEKVYGLWIDGWISEVQILETFGPRFMELLALQHLHGTTPQTIDMAGFDERVIVVGSPEMRSLVMNAREDTQLDGDGPPGAEHDEGGLCVPAGDMVSEGPGAIVTAENLVESGAEGMEMCPGLVEGAVGQATIPDESGDGSEGASSRINGWGLRAGEYCSLYPEATVATRGDAVTLEEAKQLLSEIERRCSSEDEEMEVSAS
ncbi:unnamed protein product [Symbiodinium sp. CCMP2592]|nr:unnamed protein product [Symbiodinium sp. CCMP2592]